MSVGSVVRGLDLWLVDELDRVIEDDDVCGEIKVAGTSVSPGYWCSDGPLDAIAQTGLRTGDIGFLHKGDLFVVERIKNIIIRNGENHSALLLEREIADALDRPRSDIVVIDSDVRPGLGRVTAILGVDQKDDFVALEATVRDAQDQLSLAVEDLVFVPRGALPRTTSGKKQHARIRALLAEREITTFARVALTPMPPEREDVVIDLIAIDAVGTTSDIVTRMARRQGVTTDITEAMHLTHDLGFDSLARLELAATIEDKTGLGISEERLGTIQTVGDLLRTVDEIQSLPAGAVGMSVSAMIAQLTSQIPQTDLIVDRQIGRQLQIGDRAITDFGSLNYLGLDLRPDVIASVEPMLKQWGTHPSWTRAVASPAPYRDLERELAELVDAPEVMVFPTITLLHLGVLPLLAGSDGTILIDEGSHKSIREAAELAGARGATLVSVRRSDTADLELQLRKSNPDAPRIITVNGVYSMPGTLPDIAGYERLARQYDATLYIDDAHGIGVLGANPTPSLPYGSGGGGVVRHFGLNYDHVVYVAGLSKAFSSLGAFVTCRTEAERSLFLTASTMIFSGPVPVASLATALAGLRVNREEGDELRRHIHRLTMRIIDGARDAGLVVENEIGFPALTVVIGGIQHVVEACRVAWEHGILFTPAAFPAMPLDRGGLRLSVTAANTDSDVDRVLVALRDIATRVMAPALSLRH